MAVNVEDSEAIQIFGTLFNEVIAEYKEDPSYKFNPLGWCADEAGSNWEGFSLSLVMCATEFHRVFFTIDNL